MTHTDTSSRRTSLLVKNIVVSFLVKSWSAVVVLLLVPVTLHTLGEYKNGIWLTISSLLLWIDNMDIGLGNGLRNRLAAHLAHGDTRRARVLVSSTFAMLVCIMVPTAMALAALVGWGDTYDFLNVDPAKVADLDTVLTVTLLLVCSTFVFKLIGNFYMGLQMPAVSNLLTCLGQTLALAGTYIVYRSGSHSLMHVALANTAAPLVVYMLAYPYTFVYRYPHLRPSLHLVDMGEGKSVMTVGVKFFVMQVSSIVLFMTSNLLISKLYTPELVTPYQVAYRYFSLMLVVFTVVCMPFWNATTDAFERGDMGWIKAATHKLDLMTAAIFAGMVLMVLVSGPVYRLWIGHGTHVPLSMSIAMATYIFILICSMRYSYFINGIGKLRLQLIFTAGAAIAFIPLAMLTARHTHDILWLLVVMCAVNIPGLVANRVQFHRLINGKAQGIWNQ